MALRLQVQRAEGLLVLREVLPQHVPQRLGLLRAQEDGLVVADGHLLGAFARSQAEYELKIPHAHAHLHAVGIGLAVVGGLGKIQLGLLRGLDSWFHQITPVGAEGRNRTLLVSALSWIPIVAAAQKDRRFILPGLLGSKEMRVRIALVVMRAGTGRVVFGIKRGVDGMRFARMPLAPACRIDLARPSPY